MRIALFRASAVLALLSAGQLQAAQTQQAVENVCLTRPEVRGMVGYFLPSVLGTTLTTCAKQLPRDSYLLDSGPKLKTALDSGRTAAWPMAKQAFVKLGGSRDKSVADLFSALPEEALRPLVEVSITQKLGTSIKPENCADIDRVMATLAPLPPTNLIDAMTEILAIAGRKGKDFKVCSEA